MSTTPLATALVLATTPSAQVDDRIEQLVVDNAMSATLEGSSLDGDGADFLLAEAERAFCFLIGESHGNRETCRLTDWLLASLAPLRYGAFATETGPVTTEHLVELARRGGVDAVVEFNRTNPFSIAFLNWREENEVFANAVERGYRIWGLDQEFIGSGRFLLSQLRSLAKADEAKSLAASWHGKATEAAMEAMRTGNRSRVFVTMVDDEVFDAFDAAFASSGERAARILAELRATSTVYRHYNEQRYFMNNRDRIRLMKRHFADRLNAAGDMKRPKVLMKFGSAHMGRGYSLFDQLDLGNQAAELMFARGSDSFHLMVFARRSVQADGSTREFAATSPHFRPFYDAIGEDEGAVFDLRPMRPHLSARSVRAKHPDLHGLVFRFDALLILPEFHPSEELVKMR